MGSWELWSFLHHLASMTPHFPRIEFSFVLSSFERHLTQPELAVSHIPNVSVFAPRHHHPPASPLEPEVHKRLAEHRKAKQEQKWNSVRILALGTTKSILH